MSDIEETKTNLAYGMAGINALQMFCYSLAGNLPAEISEKVVEEMTRNFELVIADMSALPVPDVYLSELKKVTDELCIVLKSASQKQP